MNYRLLAGMMVVAFSSGNSFAQTATHACDTRVSVGGLISGISSKLNAISWEGRLRAAIAQCGPTAKGIVQDARAEKLAELRDRFAQTKELLKRLPLESKKLSEEIIQVNKKTLSQEFDIRRLKVAQQQIEIRDGAIAAEWAALRNDFERTSRYLEENRSNLRQDELLAMENRLSELKKSAARKETNGRTAQEHIDKAAADLDGAVHRQKDLESLRTELQAKSISIPATRARLEQEGKQLVHAIRVLSQAANDENVKIISDYMSDHYSSALKTPREGLPVMTYERLIRVDAIEYAKKLAMEEARTAMLGQTVIWAAFAFDPASRLVLRRQMDSDSAYANIEK